MMMRGPSSKLFLNMKNRYNKTTTKKYNIMLNIYNPYAVYYVR